MVSVDPLLRSVRLSWNRPPCCNCSVVEEFNGTLVETCGTVHDVDYGQCRGIFNASVRCRDAFGVMGPQSDGIPIFSGRYCVYISVN